jgi:hypothetical protein
MSSAYPILETLRDALATVPGVVTCRIGLEANMTPDDYPMVRIVPSRIVDGPVFGRRRVSVLIYFGQPIHEFDAGLESQWENLLGMEQALLQAGEATGGLMHLETFLDEDRNEAYKLMAIRADLVG